VARSVLVMRRWNRPEECFPFVRSCPDSGYCQGARANNPSYAQLRYVRGYSPRNAVGSESRFMIHLE